MEEPKPLHSTISSIIRILESKGFVTHKTYGRTHEYYAAVDKKSLHQVFLKKLVSHYFEGSMNELVSFLVHENDLSLQRFGRNKNKFKS